jgi:hypothetical protein
MKELEVFMTAALNFQVHLFSASFNTGEKYQCRPADLCNTFCGWYCEDGLDTYRKSPREACLYLIQKVVEFMDLDPAKKEAFRYRDNPMLPPPVIPPWSLNKFIISFFS